MHFSFHKTIGCATKKILNLLKSKTFYTPREIIPQNFISLGLTVLEELGDKQTHTHTHTHKQTYWHPIALEEGLSGKSDL